MHALQAFFRFRDNNLLKIERGFMCLCVFQVVLTIAFCATSGSYLNNDLLVDMRHFHTTHEEIIAFVIFITMFSVFSSLLGIWTARSRLNPSALVAVYMLTTFVGVVLPFLSQAAVLNSVSGKFEDMNIIDEHCKLSHDARVTIEDPVESFVVLSATKLDYMTEAIMEKHMCTATCPCDSRFKSQYESALTVSRLTEHSRSKSDLTGVSDLIPLVWSNDAINSFKNFETCYNRKLKDDTTSLGRKVK